VLVTFGTYFNAPEALSPLLRGIDAVLTHGGAVTTLAALSKAIPLVITPQGADQFIQAERVAAAGVGIALQPDEATPQAEVAALLDQG
jgi:UDP:flavonoid glycosyltransferase YjiC (YdhE family)